MKFIEHKYNGKDNSGFYLMEENGIAHARGYYYHDDLEIFYLDSLSVDVDHRRKGIGTNLQNIRERIAKEKGCKYVMLWVEKDTWMVKWYERRGYKYHSEYPEENGAWMKKEL